MVKLASVISKLKDLQNGTTNVSAATAMMEVSHFLNHSLDVIIQDLEQVESDLATD